MNENIKLNKEKLWKMRYDIYKLEEDNQKNKEMTSGKMADRIQQIIKDTIKEKNF